MTTNTPRSHTPRTQRHGLQVATVLDTFINEQVLPGTGLDGVLRICSSRRLGNCLLQPGCVSGAGGWIIRDSHRTKEKGIK